MSKNTLSRRDSFLCSFIYQNLDIYTTIQHAPLRIRILSRWMS